MLTLNDWTTSDTLYIPFDTYDSDGGSVTITGLAVTDIEIYKDGSVTQRASDNGYALLDGDGIDFDGVVGLHGFSVNLADNSDVGFYADGSQYWININAITVDSQTVRFTYYFTIGRILKPTTAGRTLDVSATGEGGLDFDNIKDATGAHTLTNITVPVVTLVDTLTTYTSNTPQSADNNTILANATYGNAVLVRSDNPANALIVDDSGRAEADVTAWGGESGAVSAGPVSGLPEVDTFAWSGVGVGALPATQAVVDRNADLIESQRGGHTWQGNYFYVDPVNGNDSTGDGSRALPYATIQAAHDDLVTDSNHDVIFLVAGAAGGVTTHTVAATTTISKRYCFIRGPGRDFIITRTGSGPTLAAAADGVEFSGFQLASPGASATSTGILVTAVDFIRMHKLWVLDTQGDGIHISRGSNCQIFDCHFEGTGIAASGQGVHISGAGGAGNADENKIYNNHFSGTAGTAILIDDGTTIDTLIRDNEIHNSGGWGVDIGASSVDAILFNNLFGNNASGDIQDGGTTSIIKNNRDWLSSTVESRQLDVTATGAGGIDWANVENPTTAVDLSATDIQLCDTITTYTGNTKQTGDNFARIGALGIGLTDLGGMSTAMKAEVNAEADTALADYDGPTNTEMVAAFTEIKGATWASGTDTLEAIRNRGDVAWKTATSVTVSDKTGFSLSAAGLDSIVIETGLNARQALSIAVASASGKLSGAATTTVVILGAGVATTRITATVDADGNRSAVTLAPPV